MLLYIVRHGHPDYTTDTLTERGWAQAEAVGKRIADSGITKIFSSPMGRARQTASPAARLLGLDVGIEDWTHEVGDERKTTFHFGTPTSISLIPNYMFREEGDIELPYSRQLESRVIRESHMDEALDYIGKNGDDFLMRLGYKREGGVYRIIRPNDEKVALFCHSVFARAWLSILLHIPVHMMWSNFVYNFTGVTVLDFKNYESGITSPRCLCYSDTSHLYKYGPDMIYDGGLEI